MVQFGQQTPEHLDAIIEGLAHLVCSDMTTEKFVSNAHRRLHTISPLHWDGFEALVGDDDDLILFGADANDQPVWPLDYTLACPTHAEGWPAGTWHFARVRTLDLKRWRGKLLKVTPRMVEEAILISKPDGERITSMQAWSIIGKRAQLAPLQISGGSPAGLGEFIVSPGWYGERGSLDRQAAADAESMTERLRIGAGIALRRYYCWSVLLGEGSGPRGRFTTDPVGVREAFRLRDIPPGKQRRAALLHWVKQHWRKSGRSSRQDYVQVQAYLRGAWSYNWNGLHCQIEPSIEDMDMLTERAAARA